MLHGLELFYSIVVVGAVVSELCGGAVSVLTAEADVVITVKSVSDIVVTADVSEDASEEFSDSLSEAVSLIFSERVKFVNSAVIFGEAIAMEVIIPSLSKTALSPSL